MSGKLPPEDGPGDMSDDELRRLIDMSNYSEQILEPLRELASNVSVQLAAAVEPLRDTGHLSSMLADFAQHIDSFVAGLPRLELPPLPTFQLPPGFFDLLEDFRRKQPPNWPADVDLERLESVIADDGIPLVWVPRANVLREVVAAEGRPARVAVLLEHESECLQDAEAVLASVSRSDLDGHAELATDAVRAVAAGQHHAAQALACVVVEAATRRLIHSNSQATAEWVQRDMADMGFLEVRLLAALVPLRSFFVEWNEQGPYPAPVALSRHVTVHGGSPEHYNRGNALIAVLLAASVLRALQELQEERERRGDDRWPWASKRGRRSRGTGPSKQ